MARRQQRSTYALRSAFHLSRRLLHVGPGNLRDRLNIWTPIAFSLLAGESRPFYYVLGHPKTGTNWVCKMLSGYLGIPVHEFWLSKWPQFEPSVVHMHRFLPFEGARRRTLYVMRDGRDIVVSDYHHRMRDRDGDTLLAADLDRFLGKGYDPAAVSDNLPNFIRYLMQRTDGSTDYVSHLGAAFAHPYVRVRYEDLLEDAVAALEGGLEKLLGEPVDRERLVRAVEAERFEAVTGRERGSGDSNAFVRKGISGDWKNVFNREAAEIYAAYAGETLIRCGYEPDQEWVARCAR